MKLKFGKHAKIIKNQGLNKHQYCFPYIVAMKAWIFMLSLRLIG